MAIFQRVVERGSFAGAAEDVGLSPSAVAKLITRLEQRLGVRLINRTTRHLALTAEGEIYLDRVREILSAIEAAESEVTSARALPRGHLRVHAFPVVAADHLAPALPDFLARYPHVTFDFMVTNRVVDLVGENVDLSLRIGPLEDSGLVSRKIVDLRRVVCASPSYLARNGWPAEPADLARHACLRKQRRRGYDLAAMAATLFSQPRAVGFETTERETIGIATIVVGTVTTTGWRLNSNIP